MTGASSHCHVVRRPDSYSPVCEPGGNLARDSLAETFWDGTLTAARVSLSTELKNLRRCLGSSSPLITSTRSYVGLPPCEDLRIDVREFTEHLGREQYREAIALWRGDFLQDTGGGDWFTRDASTTGAWPRVSSLN